MSVYILSGVSIYSHSDLGQNGQTHTKHCKVLPDGRRASIDSAAQTPVLFLKYIIGVGDLPFSVRE